MPSDYLTDLVDHKWRVTTHLRFIVNDLLARLTEYGDLAEYGDIVKRPVVGVPRTLADLLEVAYALKRDGLSTYLPTGQAGLIVLRTANEYLTDAPGGIMNWRAFVLSDLFERASIHDNSKFSHAEYAHYEFAFPDLQKHPYGSEEFKAALQMIQPAIAHHYQVNDHHPEYYPGGIADMNLIQLIEMLCDWMAASERSKTNFLNGMEMNKKRFVIDDHLYMLLLDTATWYVHLGDLRKENGST